MHGRGIPGTADCLRPVFGKITSALAALLWEYLRRVFTAGLNIRLCSVSPLFAATPSFFQFSGHFDREIHDRLAHQSLPLWGRWHGVAVTEEGGTMFQNLPYFGAFLPLPPPGGHPPQRGGHCGLRRKTIIFLYKNLKNLGADNCAELCYTIQDPNYFTQRCKGGAFL